MHYTLAQHPRDVEKFLEDASPRMRLAIDTEGTSLNTRICRMVGYSLSLTEGYAMYIPVTHQVGHNLSVAETWPIVMERLKDHKAELFNAKYDLNILQMATREVDSNFDIQNNFVDVLELAYLKDPDRKRKGLKILAKEDLGIDMDTFESLFTDAEIRAKKYDISTKTPERCTDYAAADADMTGRLSTLYSHIETDFPMAVRVDTALVNEIRRMEHNGGMLLNVDFIQSQIDLLITREEILRQQIFDAAGFVFELNSPKQLGDALFERMNIPSPGKTRGVNPIHSTREEVLEKLAKEHPIIEVVIAYRKVLKARTTYFKKLKFLADNNIRPRFNFNIYSAPTFRFSAPGGDPLVDGATGVNIQAISAGESRTLPGVDLTRKNADIVVLEDVDEGEMLEDYNAQAAEAALNQGKRDFMTLEEKRQLPFILGTEDDKAICIRSSCVGCSVGCQAEGIDVFRRPQNKVKLLPSVRECFMAPEGWKLMSFDYDRQELVIGANMSGEPRWLKALGEGLDLHAMTAATAFGMTLEEFEHLPKDEYKAKRAIGKTLNFATFYGATAYTLQSKANISKALAEQIYEGFERGHPTLFNWIRKMHIFAQKNGYTQTYFGRKRSLEAMYESGDPKMVAFGNRSAVNTAVQGTAAEVTRIAMVKTAKTLADNNLTWKEVRPVLQIHDELAYIVRDELITQVAPLIRDSMEIKVKSWTVQLSVGAKIGQYWGKQEEMKIAA